MPNLKRRLQLVLDTMNEYEHIAYNASESEIEHYSYDDDFRSECAALAQNCLERVLPFIDVLAYSLSEKTYFFTLK